MDYAELVKGLREHAERFNYDGWIDTAIWFEKAADAIEELTAVTESYKRSMEAWADTAGKAVEQIPRWIPVTEEPPLKVGDGGYNGYLVYANGYYEVADYTTDKFDNTPYFHVNGEYEPDVTHYMPLPEPPKEET